MSLEVDTTGEPAVVFVGGEIDLATANQLDACLRANQRRDLTVDLSAVTFLDSIGLYVLTANYRILRESGHTLRVVGEQDTVRRTLEIAGLLELLRGEPPGPGGLTGTVG